MVRDNGLYVCVVKPHGVSDKPLGTVILHGSEGRRMTTDILCFDEGSSGGVFEEHFTMTVVSLSLGIHAQTCASTETWVLARDKQRHPTPQKANIQGHSSPEIAQLIERILRMEFVQIPTETVT